MTTVLILVIVIVYTTLPSVSMGSLMNGTQSGKTIVFLYLTIAISFIVFLRTCRYKKEVPLQISILDLVLLIWCLYTILNIWLQNVSLSLRLLELCGLILLYVGLRQIRVKGFYWLLVALILGGGIQAGYGNLQLWGYYPSHHNLFKMSGSFFNPGPYAGYLASVFPITLGFYLFQANLLSVSGSAKLNQFLHKTHLFLLTILKRLKPFFPNFIVKATGKEPLTEKQIGRLKLKSPIQAGIFILPAMVLIALVLPASRSRAAWLAVLVSSGYLLIMRYKDEIRAFLNKFLNSAVKKAGVIVLSVILAGSLTAGLYHFKRGSADGRMLIWKVTGEMIREHPVTGVGFDQFKAHYMDYQANYFGKNPGSKEAMLAGDSNYAFNELLQQTAENGIVGLVLIIIALIIIFTHLSNHSLAFSHPQTFKRETSNFLKPDEGNDVESFAIIAKAGIISILLFSLFSYPAQILPIKLSLVLFLATVSSCSSQMKFTVATKKKIPFATISFKVVFAICLFFLAYSGITYINNYTDAHRSWNQAYQLYQMGVYEACLEDYEKAYPVLKNNGDFLTNYGKALSMSEKHAEAVSVLQQATKHYPNTVVYTALGDSYKVLKETEKAEQAYLHAWHMNPSRFYPKYLLAKLYDESGQQEKSIIVAKELLEKEIKIESTAIEEIKEEMRKIVEKGNAEILNKSNTQTDNDLAPIYKAKKEEAYRSVVLTGKFMLQKW